MASSNTNNCTFRGVENVSKQIEFRYADGRKLDHNFTSPLGKMRALYVHVPHTKKPAISVPKPVLPGVYTNTNNL